MSLSLAVRAGGLGFVAVVLLLSGGGDPPSADAQGSPPWVAPESEKAKKNPVASNAQSIAAGKKLTADKACTACHGESGKGDGPGAAALNPKPADWTAVPASESDGCLFWKVSTGRGAMPPWKDSLSEPERWQLVNYIRSLKKK